MVLAVYLVLLCGTLLAAPVLLPAEPAHAATGKKVLAISVDGLNPSALTRLGAGRLPNFYRLMRGGAHTLEARSEYEQNITLPDHTSMLTSRRITRSAHGHGVTWDDDRPSMTVQKAAHHGVYSVFSMVHKAGRSSALFTTKTKFGLYNRSWPSIDRYVANTDETALVRTAARDLGTRQRSFTFVHLSLPDLAGHRYGGMSAHYLTAVRQTDAQLGVLLRAIDTHPALKRRLDVVLTSDHGFQAGAKHHTTRIYANYRIPFVIWGPGVARGASLYRLNPAYRAPGTANPAYATRQPIRNGAVGNLALDLMGLGPIAGSNIDAHQNLNWH